MISNITSTITRFFATSDGEVAYHKYEDMMKSEGGKVHKAFLVEIANGLLKYMVSSKFTELSAYEKDVQQRAIYECKQLIDFLMDPAIGLRRQNIIAAHNKKMEQTVRKPPKKGNDR